MIDYLSIDLETKSGTDLSKSGVYRYTEDPEFEILLFGYSFNGGSVSVVDMELSCCVSSVRQYSLYLRRIPYQSTTILLVRLTALEASMKI